MKKLLGIMMAVLAGLAVSLPVGAVDIERPDATEHVPVVTSAGEDGDKGTEGETNSSDTNIEIAPTFKAESLENEDLARLWAGRNLLVAGNNINTDIKAPAGLMLVAGNNLELQSESEYGFIFGNNINFAGNTERDLFMAGNNIVLQRTAKIGRDIYSSSASLTISADIPGSVSGVAAVVELKDVNIGGNLNLTADRIKITGKVEVAGTFTYNDNAEIQGLEHLTADRTETFHVEEANQAVVVLARVYGKIMSITALFLAMAIIFYFCPRLHRHVEGTTSTDRFGSVLVKGLGVFLAVPVAAILAFLTYVAAPLGIVAILLYLVLIYLSQGFAGLWLGHVIVEKIFKSKTHVLVEALVGIVTLGALALIPYVGALTGFVGMILGLGLIFECVRPCKDQVVAETVEAKAEKSSKKED